ncbi:MAG: hypothetical protein IPL78_25290 [Chloroflexi bacterium]|nr:hypothetical protein [Chloroflexota bacterium]
MESLRHALLIFAVVHGLNGLRNVLEDFIHNPTTTRWITRFLVVFCIITIIWAGIGIASFDSERLVRPKMP